MARAQVVACAGDASPTRLYERFGFTPARYFLGMTAPTSEAPAAGLPAGVRIAPYDPARAQELHAVHTAAFRGQWGYQERTFDSWAPLTVGSSAFLPALSKVALAGEDVAAYVLAYASEIPGRRYVGHVGTAGPWRRKSIAGALLAGVLADAGRSEQALRTAAPPRGRPRR